MLSAGSSIEADRTMKTIWRPALCLGLCLGTAAAADYPRNFAQYVAMRVLKNPDAFPASDLGLLKAIAYPDRVTAKELTARAEAWRPWRAYAALLLWGSLPGSGG